MHTYAQNLMNERDSLTEMATTLAERAATEGRDLTDTEQGNLAAWSERCADIDAQLRTAQEHMQSTRAWADLRHSLGELDGDAGGDGLPVRAPGRTIEVRGWGDTFTESDAFRSYDGHRTSGHVEMPWGLLEERAPADPILSTQLPDTPHRFDPATPTWRNPLLDAVGREPVNSNSVEWVKFVPSVPAAAPVVPEGALKPPLDISTVEDSANLATYAVWKAITRQALEDYSRIRAIVESYLRESLRRALAGAVASAIAADATIPRVGLAADPLLASIRLAIAQVEINGFTPNALLLNPGDAAAMDITVTAGAQIIPGIQRGFWGLTTATDPAIPSGTAYVGDLRNAVTLFDRNRTAVYVTDSHADNFLRNVLVILAETRALAVVTAPTAMCKAIGDPTACIECADGNVPADTGSLSAPAPAMETVTDPTPSTPPVSGGK